MVHIDMMLIKPSTAV